MERGAHQGLHVESHPLSTVGPVPWPVPDASTFDAVLVGSVNALRFGGDGLAALTDLPALCVGEATAHAARAAGFNVIAVGARGMQTLLPHAEARGLKRLLRLSGEAHASLDVPDGVSVSMRTLYRLSPVPMSQVLADTLSRGALVLLHSGEAARHFGLECGRKGVPRSQIALACLAPRIANHAGKGWARCQSAPTPDDTALLALAKQMCQSGLPGNE